MAVDIQFHVFTTTYQFIVETLSAKTRAECFVSLDQIPHMVPDPAYSLLGVMGASYEYAVLREVFVRQHFTKPQYNMCKEIVGDYSCNWTPRNVVSTHETRGIPGETNGTMTQDRGGESSSNSSAITGVKAHGPSAELSVPIWATISGRVLCRKRSAATITKDGEITPIILAPTPVLPATPRIEQSNPTEASLLLNDSKDEVDPIEDYGHRNRRSKFAHSKLWISVDI